MLFFPTVGYGYWLYYHTKKLNNKENFPLKWYVWKKMIKVNWGFLILIALFFLILSSGILDLFVNTNGFDWANHQDNAVAIGFGLLSDVGSALFGLLGLLCLAITFGVFFCIFILIPILVVKSIETNYYKDQLLSNQKHNEQQH